MQTKYELTDMVLGGRLRDELEQRRERGDSFQSIAFWLRASHGIEVSIELIRQWCQSENQDIEATG